MGSLFLQTSAAMRCHGVAAAQSQVCAAARLQPRGPLDMHSVPACRRSEADRAVLCIPSGYSEQYTGLQKHDDSMTR